MKKLFTIDDFVVAAIAAMGYGFGEAIGRLFGLPDILCIVACLAVGITLEGVISRIVYNKTVQKSRTKRICTYAAVLLVFLVGQFIASRWMGMSLAEYVEEEFAFVVILPIIGFVLNLIIRAYRVYKIRKLYGDGSDGYVYQ